VEYGAWAKYAFVNNGEEGFSFSGLAGLGASFEGLYGYLGPVVSYKMGIFEPYFLTRFNYVSFPEQKIAASTIGEVRVAPGVYRYFQHTLGFMLWPLDWAGLGLEASSFGTLGSPFILQGSNRLIFSGNFSFRF
jgi:hypothetical protein